MRILIAIVLSALTFSAFADQYPNNPIHKNNRYEWSYNNQYASSYVAKVPDIGYQLIIDTLNELEQFCNIDFIYKGETTAKLSAYDNINTVMWDSPVNSQIFPGGYTQLTVTGPFLNSSDMIFNFTEYAINNRAELVSVLRHESLHAIGFEHNKQRPSLLEIDPYMDLSEMTKYYDYDIRDCQRVYGVRTHNTQVSKATTYSGSLLSATATLVPDEIDLGASRNVYVVAFYNGIMFALTSSGWQQAGTNVPAFITITLQPTQTVSILSRFDTAPFKGSGAKIYVGFGISLDAVVARNTYVELVYF